MPASSVSRVGTGAARHRASRHTVVWVPDEAAWEAGSQQTLEQKEKEAVRRAAEKTAGVEEEAVAWEPGPRTARAEPSGVTELLADACS